MHAVQKAKLARLNWRDGFLFLISVFEGSQIGTDQIVLAYYECLLKDLKGILENNV